MGAPLLPAHEPPLNATEPQPFQAGAVRLNQGSDRPTQDLDSGATFAGYIAGVPNGSGNDGRYTYAWEGPAQATGSSSRGSSSSCRAGSRCVMTPNNAGASSCAPAGGDGPEPHFGSLKRAGGLVQENAQGRLRLRPGPSLRTSTLRNGRRSTSGGRVSLLAREGGGAAGMLRGHCRRLQVRLAPQLPGLGADRTLERWFGLRHANHLWPATRALRRGGGVALRAAASCLRGRPGLRRAGAASVSVSVSGASGAGESIAASWSSPGAGCLVLAAGRNTMVPSTSSTSSRSPVFRPSWCRRAAGNDTHPS